MASKSFSEMAIQELWLECVKRKIKGFKGKSQKQIVEMIEAHDAAIGSSVNEIVKDKKEEKKVGKKKSKKEEVVEEEVDEFEEATEEEEEVVDEGEETAEEFEAEAEEEEEKPSPTIKAKKEKKVSKKKEKTAPSPVKVKGEKKVKEKPAPVTKAKKEKKVSKPGKRGRKAIDNNKLFVETGNPFSKGSSMAIAFRLIKKGGLKSDIIEGIEATCKKEDCKCTNPIGIFNAVVTKMNGGIVKGHSVVKNEKGKYSIVKE